MAIKLKLTAAQVTRLNAMHARKRANARLGGQLRVFRMGKRAIVLPAAT